MNLWDGLADRSGIEEILGIFFLLAKKGTLRRPSFMASEMTCCVVLGPTCFSILINLMLRALFLGEG